VDLWDTFGFFERLLARYDDLVSGYNSATASESREVAAARAGFSLFQPLSSWNEELEQIVVHKLDGELSLEALDWFEEAAPAIRIFSILAVGALLAKWAAGEIDDRGFLLGDAHLPAFTLENNQAIMSHIQAW
jgi:hypothetical protein